MLKELFLKKYLVLFVFFIVLLTFVSAAVPLDSLMIENVVQSAINPAVDGTFVREGSLYVPKNSSSSQVLLDQFKPKPTGSLSPHANVPGARETLSSQAKSAPAKKAAQKAVDPVRSAAAKKAAATRRANAAVKSGKTVSSAAKATPKVVPKYVRALPGKGGGAAGAGAVLLGVYLGWEGSQYFSFNSDCDNPIQINQSNVEYHDCEMGKCFFDLSKFGREFFDTYSNDKCTLTKNRTVIFSYALEDGKDFAVFGITYLGRDLRAQDKGGFWEMFRPGALLRIRIDNFLTGKFSEHTIREFKGVQFTIAHDGTAEKIGNKFMEIEEMRFDKKESVFQEEEVRFVDLKLWYDKEKFEVLLKSKISSQEDNDQDSEGESNEEEYLPENVPEDLSIIEYLNILNKKVVSAN